MDDLISIACKMAASTAQERARRDAGGELNVKKLLSMLTTYSAQLTELLGLEQFGELLSQVTFDPTLHTSYDPLAVGDVVYVIGVGFKRNGEIIRKVEVASRKPAV